MRKSYHYLFLLFLMFFVPGFVSAEIGDYIGFTSISSITTFERGLTWDGDNFWLIADTAGTDTAYRLTSSFASDSYSFSLTAAGMTSPSTVDFYNGDLYIANNTNKTAFSVTRTGALNDSWTLSDFSRSIATDGAYWWVEDDGNSNVIRQYSLDFVDNSTTIDKSLCGSGHESGLAIAGGYFWAVDLSDDLVYAIAYDGFCALTFDIGGTVNGNDNPVDIAWDGNYFYILDSTDNGVYKYEAFGLGDWPAWGGQSTLPSQNDFSTRFLSPIYPAPDSVLSSSTVFFSGTLFNGFPALDSTWQICFDAYPFGDNQSPNIITKCSSAISASGQNTFSTTTILGYGDYNILWYAYDTVNLLKRFARAYNVNIGGFDPFGSFQTLLPVDPTTDSEASSTIKQALRSLYRSPTLLYDRFPMSWLIDLYEIFDGIEEDEVMEFEPVALNFEDLDLSLWEKLPNATSTFHAQGVTANFTLFSTSTIADVADMSVFQSLRALAVAILWIGFATYVVREGQSLMDKANKG